jgi:hypothetical protein
MRKDIIMPTVEGVYVAVVRKFNENKIAEWYVYLINDNTFPLENLIVSSRGYGEIEGEQRQTSVLRHAFGTIAAQSQVLVEPIDSSVFPLYNEYWVSYYIGMDIYDKRFTFVPESIIEDNLITIKQLNVLGILHE